MRYVIYSGALQGSHAHRTGLVVDTDVHPNADGVIVLTAEEYNNGFSTTTPQDNFDDLYDATCRGDIYVIHPAPMPHDAQAVQRALCDSD